MIHFFASHGAHGSRGNAAFHHQAVTDDVKLFLILTLNVFGAGHAENAGKRAAAYFVTDFLTRFSHSGDKVGKFLRQAVFCDFRFKVMLQCCVRHN